MQVFTLIMLLGLLICERLQNNPDWTAPLADHWMVATMVGPHLALIGLVHLVCAMATIRIQRRPKRIDRTIRRVEGVLVLCRFGSLGFFLTDLFLFKRMVWLETHLGPMILVNDLLAMAPILSVVIASWWSTYPLFRAVRQRPTEEEAAAAAPVIPTLGQYLIMQVRHQLLLMMAPLLVLLVWIQGVAMAAQHHEGLVPYQSWITLAGTLGIFLLAPLLIRLAWDTEPMPPGPLRDRLAALCRQYRVGVRQLLIWKTYGGMINGAVMGLVGSLRYILLTDGLIEQMDPKQIEAVMAHELGHVKGHHMPLMALCAISLLMVMTEASDALAFGLGHWMDLTLGNPSDQTLSSVDRLLSVGLMVATLLAWAACFGFISRRFERQADTFAARHMAQTLSGPDTTAQGRFEHEAVDLVREALITVARLNHLPMGDQPHTGWRGRLNSLGNVIHHWRHGSIRWRIDYLQSLSGQPLQPTGNDRFLRMLCLGCALALGAYFAWHGGWFH